MIYLDIVYTHYTPTVVHVLLQIFFLWERENVVLTFRFLKHITVIGRYKCSAYTHAHTLTRYSNTSVRHLSVWIMSWRVTILACFKSFSRDTVRRRQRKRQSNPDNKLSWKSKAAGGGVKPSLMAVQGAPSSCSSRISFRATKLSVSLLRPLNTVAYVPWQNSQKHAQYQEGILSFIRLNSGQLTHLTSPNLSSLM